MSFNTPIDIQLEGKIILITGGASGESDTLIQSA